MISSRSRPDRPLRTGSLLALPALLLGMAACDSSPTDIEDPNGDHADAARAEIHTRGAASALLAVWTDGAGWTDGNGNSITQLPNPVDVEGEGLLPLRAGDRNASLTVIFFEPDGSEVEMATLSRDGITGERECTPFEARYFPLDTDTGVIAWPNMRHPDSPTGPFQFARRTDDELVAIFHCDHIYFYPEAPGTVEVEFHLWHIDHSDMATDPIAIVVDAGDL
jgi:hypothetical protein